MPVQPNNPIRLERNVGRFVPVPPARPPSYAQVVRSNSSKPQSGQHDDLMHNQDRPWAKQVAHFRYSLSRLNTVQPCRKAHVLLCCSPGLLLLAKLQVMGVTVWSNRLLCLAGMNSLSIPAQPLHPPVLPYLKSSITYQCCHKC